MSAQHPPLALSEEAHKAIIAHAEQGYPHEVVGILAGPDPCTVSRAVPLVNERAENPERRYQVSGLVVMRASERLEAEGFTVVGYYHSHPDHTAQYSDYDRDHALPNLTYAILSVRAGRGAELRAWRLREDRGAMDEQHITTEERIPS